MSNILCFHYMVVTEKCLVVISEMCSPCVSMASSCLYVPGWKILSYSTDTHLSEPLL